MEKENSFINQKVKKLVYSNYNIFNFLPIKVQDTVFYYILSSDDYTVYSKKSDFFRRGNYYEAAFFYYNWYLNYFSCNSILFEKLFYLKIHNNFNFTYFVENCHRLFQAIKSNYIPTKIANIAMSIEMGSLYALYRPRTKSRMFRWQRHVQLQPVRYYSNMFKKYLHNCNKIYFKHMSYFDYSRGIEDTSRYYNRVVRNEIGLSFFYSFILSFFNLFFLFTLIMFSLFTVFNFLKSKKFKTFEIILLKINSYSEQSLSNFFDIKNFFIFYLLFFYSFFVYNFQFNLFLISKNSLSFYIFTLIGICFIIPISFLYFFGSFFLSCIKGQTKTSMFSQQYFFDIMSLYAFFVRFVLQSVRVILIFLVFFVYHEFIMSEFFINYFCSNYSYPFLNEFLNFLRFLAEIIDFFLIFFIQGFAYLAIIF